MRTTTTSEHNTLRGLLSATQAARVASAAASMFEAGGRKLLDERARQRLRSSVEGLGRRSLLGLAPDLVTAQVLAAHTPKLLQLGPHTARAALKEVARGVGTAAARGAALDAAVGAAEAGVRWRRGELDRAGAVRHVAVEAGTGGLAAAAGVGAVALLVAATGPVGWGTTVAVAGGVSGLTKLALVSNLG